MEDSTEQKRQDKAFTFLLVGFGLYSWVIYVACAGI